MTGMSEQERYLMNWSGSLRFTPERIFEPESEEEVKDIVRQAADQGCSVRVLGSSHSSTGILATDGWVILQKRLQGLISYDPRESEATLLPGTTIEQAGKELLESDLAMPNMGDVATQMIAGAIGTGTHGTGRTLKNLSSMLIGGRMVTGTGEIVEFDEESDPEFLKAARVSLGTIGIFTQMKLRLMPSYRLQRREYCTPVEVCLNHLDELVSLNRHFDFYWYPRSDQCRLRLLNVRGAGSDVGYADPYETHTGWAHQIIPKHSNLPYKFDEMEYEIPFDAGIDCFLEVRTRILKRWRREVGWRVLWRTIAADDSYLSPANGRETVSISLHHNAPLPFREFFADIEPVFRSYQGRPHWAKKHSLKAESLRPLYPDWDRFQEIRRSMDPQGVFLSSYLCSLFGEERGKSSGR